MKITKHLSHEKNPTLLSIESWLVNRDPYFMAYEIVPIFNWVVFHPLYIYPKQQNGALFSLLNLNCHHQVKVDLHIPPTLGAPPRVLSAVPGPSRCLVSPELPEVFFLGPVGPKKTEARRIPNKETRETSHLFPPFIQLFESYEPFFRFQRYSI